MSETHDILANEILTHIRTQLLIPLRFLDVVIFKCARQVQLHNDHMQVLPNGLSYPANQIIADYAQSPSLVARNLLHMICHGIFQHSRYLSRGDALWNLACDMAVENTILSFQLPLVAHSHDTDEQRILNDYAQVVPELTAEKLYRHFVKYPPTNLDFLLCLFAHDVHHIYQEEIDSVGNETDNHGFIFSQEHYNLLESQQQNHQVQWLDMSEQLALALEMRQSLGQQLTTLKQQLKVIRKPTIRYDEFLRKFAMPCEAIQVDIDSFDPIFYTYGLKTYGNMPLIEPLETVETTKIDDFVIAIDTSGSCSGSLVQRFIDETISILKTGERFQEQVNIHVIQCDNSIQDEQVIKHLNDLPTIFRKESLKGFGGTDFRPVFAHVNKLLEEGNFSRLRGLIYFTDGLGFYPKEAPSYETAFIFPEDSPYIDDIDFPSWAIRVLFNDQQINID